MKAWTPVEMGMNNSLNNLNLWNGLHEIWKMSKYSVLGIDSK